MDESRHTTHGYLLAELLAPRGMSMREEARTPAHAHTYMLSQKARVTADKAREVLLQIARVER